MFFRFLVAFEGFVPSGFKAPGATVNFHASERRKMRVRFTREGESDIEKERGAKGDVHRVRNIISPFFVC